MQKQISDGKQEDSNAISRIFLNRRQGAGHLMPSCSSPFPVFGNRVNNTYIGSKQWNQSIPDKRAQQDRGVRTTLSLHGSHCLLFLSRSHKLSGLLGLLPSTSCYPCPPGLRAGLADLVLFSSWHFLLSRNAFIYVSTYSLSAPLTWISE